MDVNGPEGYQLVDTAAIGEHYACSGLPVISLMRSYTNDVFRVSVGGQEFVLKVYAVDWRTDAAIAYELELLRHLDAKGIAAAQPIAAQDGSLLMHLVVGGVRRQAVLFAFAPGSKPQPPFTLDLYYREGQATAALHGASDDFVSGHEREPLDVHTRILEPRATIATAASPGPDARFLDRFGAALAEAITQAAARGLDWGPCHGDLTYDNLHITDDGGFVWYDFDSGGPGWRAVDLQGWVAKDPAMQERQDAFVAGYRTVRHLDDADVAASPLLAAADEYWGVGIDLRYWVQQRGVDAVREYLTAQAASLRAWSAILGLDSD